MISRNVFKKRFHKIYKARIPKHNTNKSRTRMNMHHHSLDRKAPGGSTQYIDEERNKKGLSGPASGSHHEHEGQVPSAREDHGHDEHHQNHDHHAHHAHMVANFRRRFWVSLVLTLAILVLSPMLQKLLGLREAIRFSGDLYVLFAFSSAVFFYW
jgi:cation transport ATPase